MAAQPRDAAVIAVPKPFGGPQVRKLRLAGSVIAGVLASLSAAAIALAGDGNIPLPR